MKKLKKNSNTAWFLLEPRLLKGLKKKVIILNKPSKAKNYWEYTFTGNFREDKNIKWKKIPPSKKSG